MILRLAIILSASRLRVLVAGERAMTHHIQVYDLKILKDELFI